jgi:hypothetical protein
MQKKKFTCGAPLIPEGLRERRYEVGSTSVFYFLRQAPGSSICVGVRKRAKKID